MCYEHYHNCKYCNTHYICSLPNKQCPTVNFDKDKNMCDTCRSTLEEIIKDFELKDALRMLKEINAK